MHIRTSSPFIRMFFQFDMLGFWHDRVTDSLFIILPSHVYVWTSTSIRFLLAKKKVSKRTSPWRVKRLMVEWPKLGKYMCYSSWACYLNCFVINLLWFIVYFSTVKVNDLCLPPKRWYYVQSIHDWQNTLCSQKAA